MENKEVSHRRLAGIVTSTKMDKTVIVSVTKPKKHPKYLKYRKRTKKLKVHDEKNEYGLGDEVIIEETRPISKEKRWRVVELTKKVEGSSTGSL